MKPVLLRITGTPANENEVHWLDTIKEAQEKASANPDCDFGIYTLYMTGARPTEITWELNTEPVANLIANKQAKAAKPVKKGGRAGAWTVREVATLMEARKKKMPIREIAVKLGRSYNSCYMKSLKENKRPTL
jgi:hypothetical protein